MEKWIVSAIIVLMIAAFISILSVDQLNEPATCVNCHGNTHQGSPLADRHFNKTITCIECHSGSSVKEYVDARKEMIDAILLTNSRNILNIVFHNYSNASHLIHLKANCIKCHVSVNTRYYNHTYQTICTQCHIFNGTYPLPETGLLQKMGSGGHRNKTCEDCHSNNFRIPECTGCHIPHKENSGWDNSVCLGCHNSPHIPVLNGSFNTNISKDKCEVCHEAPFQTLAFYNSKHNRFNSCVNCHPMHMQKKKCFDCHMQKHTVHPFAQKNCNGCHGKVQCKDCHIDPHAPLRGLPRISTDDQLNDYAESKKNH